MSTSLMMMIISIVAISVIGGGFFRWLELRDKTLGGSRIKQLEDKLQFLEQQQLPAMQERLNVLEKIVTDEGYDLKQQINSL